MRREDTDPNNVQPTDVLCDFCGTEWGDDTPIVEGHQGSCVCGKCLSVAWRALVGEKMNDAPDGGSCTMCLEERSDPLFRSPIREEALICRRCVRLAARALDIDPDHAWTKPPTD